MEKVLDYIRKKNILTCGLLVLYSFLFAYLPYKTICFGAVVIILILIIDGNIKRIPFDVSIIFLAQAMITKIYYGGFFVEGIDNVDVYMAICPTLAYILGLIIVQSTDYFTSRVLKYYFCLMGGLALNGTLCYVCELLGRNIPNNVVSGESYALLIESMLLGFNSALLFFAVNWKKHKVIYSCCIIFSILSQLLMVSRYRRYNAYIFVITVFVLMLFLCFNILMGKMRSKVNVCITTSFIGIGLLLIAGLCIKLDIFSIRTYYYNSFWGADGGIFHNLRFKNIAESIMHLYEDPTSGFVIASNNLNTSFNMWLDYARDYGVYVFGFLLVFLCLTIYNFLKMLINPQVDKSVKCVLTMAFLAFNMFYFFESLARGFIHIWLWGLFINGMIRAYSTYNNRWNRE